MRKKDDTLRETLLCRAREIADAGGAEAVNIRTIAQNAGIAAGTVYHYFSGKDEILLALTEEYWKETLQDLQETVLPGDFCLRLEEIYDFLKKRIEHSAGPLMHSLENVQAAGKARMESAQARFGALILWYMEQDEAVQREIWTEEFTKEQFADFIVMNLTMLLETEADDIRFLTGLVRRTIY